MLKLLDMALLGENAAPLSSEAWLGTLVIEGAPWLKSMDVFAVWRDSLELVSEVVGVAEEVDHPRMLRVFRGTSSGLSPGLPPPTNSGTGSGISWIVKGPLVSTDKQVSILKYFTIDKGKKQKKH
jgi:hypothetical protein